MRRTRTSSGGDPYNTYSPSSDPTVTLLSDTVRVNIVMVYDDPGDPAVAVGHITFQRGSNAHSPVSFIVGEGAYMTDDTPMSSEDALKCSSWKGASFPDHGNVYRLYGRVTGDLDGSGIPGLAQLAFINLDRMSRLDVQGELNSFLAVGSPASTSFVLTASSFTELGRVKLDQGDITLIQVAADVERPTAANEPSISAGTVGEGNIARLDVGGNLEGDVVCRGYDNDAVGGRIGQIIVGGHIGREYTVTEYGDPASSAAFPTLNSSVLNGPVLCIEASNGIDLVEADTMTCLIEADRGWTSSDAPGNLESVVTRSGSFKGLLKAQGLKDNDTSTGGATVDIAGDFRGRVKLDEDPVPAPFYGLMKVRGSLLPLTLTVSGSPSVVNGFECHSNSFHGQIIVNAADDSESWTSAIIIGSTTISHTDGVYSTPSASLGGGAVGLAPFPFYEVDCVPPNNELDPTDGILYSAFDDPSPVLLRWTGPIRMPAGEGLVPKDLVTIEVENPGTGGECQWIDLSTIFTVTLHPDGHERTLGIGAIVWPREGVYRVRYSNLAYTESKFFECAEVEGNPPVNFPEDRCEEEFFSYTFRILADCDNDDESDLIQIAGNQSLDTNYNGYLDSCEFIDPCACDWDDDGVLEVADIFDFLPDWFANEPAAINFGGASGVGAIFAYLNCWFAMACE